MLRIAVRVILIEWEVFAMESNLLITVAVLALCSIVGVYYIFVRKSNQTQSPAKPG